MLKSARFEKDEKFVQRLANSTLPKPKTIQVKAQELELPDDAVQAAQAYWLQGWSWEEIEATLIDSEYTDAEIKRALKEAQDYAEKVNSQGPFASDMTAGQQVKLISGTIAQLVNYSPENVLVDDGQDQYIVSPDQIDLEATKRLNQASKLRAAAEKLVAAPKPKKPAEPEQEFAREPDPKETYKFTFPEKAPPGLREKSPEKGQVPAASKALTAMVKQLQGIKEVMDARFAEITEIKSLAKSLEQENKAEAIKYQEITQALFASLNEEFEALDAMDAIIFRDYEEKILALRRTMVELQYPPTAEDQLVHILQHLEQAHPKIAKECQEVLEKFAKSNTKIEDMIEHVGAVYMYKKTSKKAQLIDKVTEWVKGIWQSIAQGVSTLYSKVFPATEEITAEIDEYLSASHTASVRVTYASAMQSMRQAKRASYLPRPKLWQR